MQGNDKLNQRPNSGRWGPLKAVHLTSISIVLWVLLAGFMAYRWLAPAGSLLAPPRAPPATVLLHLRTSLNPGADIARTLSPARRLTVILISFAFFFVTVAWSGRKLVRAMRS